MEETKKQFEHVIAVCRDLFAKKLHDYGAAWRIMRPSSVTRFILRQTVFAVSK